MFFTNVQISSGLLTDLSPKHQIKSTPCSQLHAPGLQAKLVSTENFITLSFHSGFVYVKYCVISSFRAERKLISCN